MSCRDFDLNFHPVKIELERGLSASRADIDRKGHNLCSPGWTLASRKEEISGIGSEFEVSG